MPSAETTPERTNGENSLLIFPFNGNGMEAVECVHSSYRLIGFVDDEEDKWNESVAGFPVTGRNAFTDHAESYVLAVPGSPSSYRARRQVSRGVGTSRHLQGLVTQHGSGGTDT